MIEDDGRSSMKGRWSLLLFTGCLLSFLSFSPIPQTKGIEVPERGNIFDSSLYLQSKSPHYLPDLSFAISLIENQKVFNTIKCESSLGKNKHNFDDPNGGSHGIAQFQHPTFMEFCVHKYGYSGSDYMDDVVQIKCMNKMFEDGYAYKWSCYQKIYGKK